MWYGWECVCVCVCARPYVIAGETTIGMFRSDAAAITFGQFAAADSGVISAWPLMFGSLNPSSADAASVGGRLPGNAPT